MLQSLIWAAVLSALAALAVAVHPPPLSAKISLARKDDSSMNSGGQIPTLDFEQIPSPPARHMLDTTLRSDDDEGLKSIVRVVKEESNNRRASSEAQRHRLLRRECSKSPTARKQVGQAPSFTQEAAGICTGHDDDFNATSVCASNWDLRRGYGWRTCSEMSLDECKQLCADTEGCTTIAHGACCFLFKGANCAPDERYRAYTVYSMEALSTPTPTPTDQAPTETTPTPSPTRAPSPQIVFTIIIQSVSYEDLMNNMTIHDGLVNGVRGGIAEQAGDFITPAMVDVVLTSGSVVAKITITLPDGFDINDIDEKLRQSVASGTMQMDVEKKVEEVPGITPYLTGSVSVTADEPVVKTAVPTWQPTPKPTVEPTESATYDFPPDVRPRRTIGTPLPPTAQPTTAAPTTTAFPTESPTPSPTNETESPTPAPTENVTEEPTAEPTAEPTVEPTNATEEPTAEPTVEPTNATEVPTVEPTPEPTAEPTVEPTNATEEPTPTPTGLPTVSPTYEPRDQIWQGQEILRVSFQPVGNVDNETDESIPVGWVVDNGGAKAKQTNGFNYGWRCGTPATTVVKRNKPEYTDMQNTLALPNKNGGCDDEQWSIEVPNNKEYTIMIVIQDPNAHSRTSGCTLQGSTLGMGEIHPGAIGKKTFTMSVSDGLITFAGSWAEQCNSINRLTITPKDPLPAAPTVSNQVLYVITERQTYCPFGGDIGVESTCRQAAAYLGFPYNHAFNVAGWHKGCLFADDGRSAVYFNSAPPSTAGSPDPSFKSLCNAVGITAMVPFVEFEMKLDNIDYADLLSHSSAIIPTLVERFTTTITQGVVAASGPGIEPENVQVTLSAGSVVARIKITPPYPGEVNATDVATLLGASPAPYNLTGDTLYCETEHRNKDIASEDQCRKAAEFLKLTYYHSWNGVGAHKGCFFADDGRSKVYWNSAAFNLAAATPSANFKSLCSTWGQLEDLISDIGTRVKMLSDIQSVSTGEIEVKVTDALTVRRSPAAQALLAEQAPFYETKLGEKCGGSTAIDAKPGEVKQLVEAKCIEAASSLGISWHHSWSGAYDVRGCVWKAGRVYFNSADADKNQPPNPNYKGICDSRTCDWKCYLDRYSDVRNATGSNDKVSNWVGAQQYFNDYGKVQGHDCTCPDVSSCNWQCYLDRYDDVFESFGGTNVVAAEKHYRQTGLWEGRSCTCPDPEDIEGCDWQCYLARNADVQSIVGDNISKAKKHYINSGMNECRDCTCPIVSGVERPTGNLSLTVNNVNPTLLTVNMVNTVTSAVMQTLAGALQMNSQDLTATLMDGVVKVVVVVPEGMSAVGVDASWAAGTATAMQEISAALIAPLGAISDGPIDVSISSPLTWATFSPTPSPSPVADTPVPDCSMDPMVSGTSTMVNVKTISVLQDTEVEDCKSSCLNTERCAAIMYDQRGALCHLLDRHFNVDYNAEPLTVATGVSNKACSEARCSSCVSDFVISGGCSAVSAVDVDAALPSSCGPCRATAVAACSAQKEVVLTVSIRNLNSCVVNQNSNMLAAFKSTVKAKIASLSGVGEEFQKVAFLGSSARLVLKGPPQTMVLDSVLSSLEDSSNVSLELALAVSNAPEMQSAKYDPSGSIQMIASAPESESLCDMCAKRFKKDGGCPAIGLKDIGTIVAAIPSGCDACEATIAGVCAPGIGKVILSIAFAPAELEVSDAVAASVKEFIDGKAGASSSGSEKSLSNGSVVLVLTPSSAGAVENIASALADNVTLFSELGSQLSALPGVDPSATPTVARVSTPMVITPALPSSLTMAPTPTPTLDPRQAWFYRTERGTYCPPGTQITSEAQCTLAANSLGYVWDYSYNIEDVHKGCLYADDGRQKVYFNSNTNDTNVTANPLFQSLCDVRSCDWSCYLDRYSDVRSATGSDDNITSYTGDRQLLAEEHYRDIGSLEGRDCTCPGESGVWSDDNAAELTLAPTGSPTPPTESPTPDALPDNGTFVPVSTTMTAGVSAGATQLDVVSTAGFAAGDEVQISDAYNSEQSQIGGIGSIILLSPTLYSYTVGATVAKLQDNTTEPTATPTQAPTGSPTPPTESPTDSPTGPPTRRRRTTPIQPLGQEDAGVGDTIGGFPSRMASDRVKALDDWPVN